MAASPSLRLLAALPVPDATWEPREPRTQASHHPRGILRHALGSHVSGEHPIVRLDEPPVTTRTGTER